MPFIDSKVSVKASEEQKRELKERLGQAISIIPGKSESWLMVNIEDDQKMYFRGDDSEPVAFVSVNIYGSANPSAFSKMTAELTKIYGDLFEQNKIKKIGDLDAFIAKRIDILRRKKTD